MVNNIAKTFQNWNRYQQNPFHYSRLVDQSLVTLQMIKFLLDGRNCSIQIHAYSFNLYMFFFLEFYRVYNVVMYNYIVAQL